MMDTVTTWLLEGDPAIRYQAARDLLGRDDGRLQRSILREGWGAAYLAARNVDGSWGRGFYQPKWISTHYTLLDLKNMAVPRDAQPRGMPSLRDTVEDILARHKAPDGGARTSKGRPESDACVNGMLLNYASYFGAEVTGLRSLVDFLLANRLPDGGFNCEYNRSSGVRHSSLHTTLSVLEGMLEYRRARHTYRLDEVRAAEASAVAFILLHRFFLSDRSGEIIDRKFLRLTWPYRWKYTVLRALDFFRDAGLPYDEHLQPALDYLLHKHTEDGRWKLQSRFSGREHFEMEAVGEPSRWITLIALRVLRRYAPNRRAARAGSTPTPDI